MRSSWEALRAGLLRSIQDRESRATFDELKSRSVVFARFETPVDLVAAVSPDADLDARRLRSDALQDGVGANPVRQLLDASDALVTALGDDVGRAEVAGKFLPHVVTAHHDDPLGAHLLGREDGEQTDRAVSDDGDRLARFHQLESAHPN
jgi:hypothetical protein